MKIAVMTLTMLPALAQAAPLPLPKTGSCPSGYFASGGHCAPISERTAPAVPKPPGKQCPAGFAQSGNYCLKIGR